MLSPTNLDRAFLAFADPTRRAILDRLSQGEARVGDVALPFPISLNSVSKHIRMLEQADLVRRRKAGRDHFLSLNARAVNEVAKWVESRRLLWARRLDKLDQLLGEDI